MFFRWETKQCNSIPCDMTSFGHTWVSKTVLVKRSRLEWKQHFMSQYPGLLHSETVWIIFQHVGNPNNPLHSVRISACANRKCSQWCLTFVVLIGCHHTTVYTNDPLAFHLERPDLWDFNGLNFPMQFSPLSLSLIWANMFFFILKCVH